MKFLKLIVALCAILDCTMIAEAGERRSKRKAEAAVTVAKVSMEQANTSELPKSSAVKQSLTTGSDDALAEVNEYRAKRGLTPFKPDPLLTQAAASAAKQRATRSITGHLPESDFSYLPAGAHADSAGCGALDDSWGWGTCCMNDNYAYAGAAWVRGSDGKRYMHLFVSNSPASTTKQTAIEPPQPTGEVIASAGSCASGQCPNTTAVRQYGGVLSRGRRGR